MTATTFSEPTTTPFDRLRRTMLFVLAFAVATALSMHLRVATGGAALWLANAVIVAGLLMLDRRSRLPFVALCCGTAMIVSPLLTGKMGLTFWIYLTCNLVESVGVAWLACKLCGPRLDFSRGRQLALLAGGAVLPMCLATALIEGQLIGRFSTLPSQQMLWFQSHALAAIIVVPAMTILARPRLYRAFVFDPAELFAATALFGALTAGLFAINAAVPLLFLLFPAMTWLAFRYGPVGATLGMLTAGAIALCFAFANPATFAAQSGLLFSRMELMQAFLAALFFTSLPVAGAVATSARMRVLFEQRSLIAREARQRAERASKARAEFLANMSHEIRTPLNGVLGLADGLARTELKPEQRDMLKMILSSGKALTGLLSDALDLARADSGQMEIVQEAFQIRDLVQEAAFPFEHLAQAKGLSFATAFAPDLPQASVGDPLRVRQVLANLISNAIKFTVTGGVRVQVACEAGEDGQDRLILSVHDTGIGLDDDMKARLFRRFEQGDSSVTRRYGGCGLGLSIAHKLAEMMDGALTCASQPGKGSCFTLALPLTEVCALPEPAPVAPAPEEETEARLRVLLAEDHPVNQKVVQVILGDMVELTMVGDGQAAVEAFKSAPFDVILMDTHMPVMDGLTAIRTIRAFEREQGAAPLPIVSLTADAMPQQIAAALAAGADLHLAKPVSGESLIRTLQESQMLDRGEEPAAMAS